MGVVGVLRGGGGHDGGIEIAQIGQLGLVEFEDQASLDLALEEIARGHDDVIARIAGQQLGIDDLVIVIDVVIDLDAGLRLEIGDGVLGDIVGPVVDVEHRLLLRKGRARSQKSAKGNGERLFHQFSLL
ncbi:hypothetical protein D3C87_1761820 [compost metagenome]